MSDYPVILEDMPTTIKSFVRNNPDGTKTIVINAKLNYESRLKRYKHEVEHIESGEIDHDVDHNEQHADQIELVAHGLARNPVGQVPPALRRRRRKHLRKWAAMQRKIKFLQSIGYDFMAAAEDAYLEPPEVK